MTQTREEFILANFPKALTMDPYCDVAGIDEIYEALLAAGFYKKRNSSCCNKEAIIGIIMRAQGKKKKKRQNKIAFKTRTNFKDVYL